MKRTFNHPPASNTGKRYWRSLEEFADTPEFRARLEQEFPRGAAEFNGGEVSRRSFLQLMGASLALAGLSLTGCRRPELDIVAYSKSVEWQIPGETLRFATSQPRRGGALPLLATSTNGRPIKLEGNPNVPGFTGATDAFGQAAILDLYDPDRSKNFLSAVERGKKYNPVAGTDYLVELEIIKSTYAKNGGDGLAFLAEPSSSPTRARLVGELKKLYPKAIWSEYEPWSLDNIKDALGGALPVYDFSKADVILSLDADFLGASEGNVQNIAGFAVGRSRLGKSQETMSRLYAVEGRFSLTGGMADHRLRLPSANIATFASQLNDLFSGKPVDSTLPYAAWITALAKDLQAAKGRALVIAGSQQPAVVHTIVSAINLLLTSGAVSYLPPVTPAPTKLKDLVAAINAESVKTLFVLGGNPAFNAPADLKVTEALTAVEQVLHLGFHVDETAATATTHIPAAHFLETWGDARAYDGTYLAQQPLILPLWGGVSELDLLANLANLPAPKGAELVQATFAQMAKIDITAGKAFTDAWQQFVHDGYLAKISPTGNGSGAAPTTSGIPNFPAPLPSDQYELTFTLGNLDDGRYANNGWLQELPDTISKLTWDNALYVSPKTAEKFGVAVQPNNFKDIPYTDFPNDDADPGLWSKFWGTHSTIPTVKITTPDGLTLDDVPVLVSPGQADQTLTLALGWGRTAPRLTQAAQDATHSPLRVAVGVANADAPGGVNAYAIRTSATPGFIAGVKIEKTGRFTSLAIAQEHNSMEGRAIVREGTLALYHEKHDFVQDIGFDKEIPQGDFAGQGYQKYESAYDTPELNSANYQPDRPAWGMTIDLNTCVGCNTCVVACQAENNIPVVGKWQVVRGREMHWIRIDRYFGTDVSEGEPTDAKYLDEPQMLLQPMACQHCEIAPCEPVCPVNATVHNEEGLNIMAYNRCIGTRYCANNCPYKVRRFNFLNYNDRPIQNVKLPVLGETGELFLGPLAGKDGPLTYKGSPDTIAMQKNPNVSVRIRGVIEKCSYCVQRIEEAKIAQLRQSAQANLGQNGSGQITLPTDAVKAACQQACPAGAIVFGNLNDENSQVSQTKKDERNYGVLAYLGTRPRTSYLARIRNPNPAMPDASHIGKTSKLNDEAPQPEDATAH